MKNVDMKEEELESNNNSELPAVIGALLNTLDDKNQHVKQSVIESIERISKKDPKSVIDATIYFWEMHKKISTEHIASLLNILSNICKHSATSLNNDIATSLAEVAANELVGETEHEAAELLTELCKTHCMQAMGELLSKLNPGILPDPAIVFTIGKLATANPYGMLSFVKVVLTIMLPMLNQIREEVLKQAICLMISKFCEAINDYMLNVINEEVLVPEINRQSFKEEICSACDFLMQNWLRTSRDSKSTETILNALVFIIPLLSEQQNSERIIKLLPMCLNISRKSHLASVKVLAALLNTVKTESDKEAIRPFMEHMHQTLFEYVSISPYEESTRDALLTHFEVLQCSKLLVTLYPEEGLDRILQQLKSPTANQRARALVVLKYLINTLPSEDDGSLQRIALSLQESLGEDSSLQMVSAIAALAARPTFPLLPSQRAKFIRYMVLHCETKNDNKKECCTALHLLATTVDGVESWLWPCLINALLDPSCSASVISVLRSLTPLALKICNENSSTDERDFPGTKVLGRCLELLSEPANRLAVVTFLRAAAPLVGHRVKPYWDEKLVDLLQECLQNEQTSSQKSSKETKDSMQRDLIWEKKVVEWLEESVKLEGESWGGKIADELVSKANMPHVALLLAATCNNNAHITLLVELARSHGTTKEFARAVGICAQRHLNIVLKLLEDFCTTEESKKVRVKLLGLMKASSSETAKTGLLQSYAEIARRGEPKKFFPAFENHVLLWTIKQLNECKESSTKEAGLSVLEQVANAVHPTKFPEFKGLRIKATALASLLGILLSSTGYRPLQLYPAVLKAINSLIRIGPMLNNEEREIFLSSILDKVIGASSEIDRHLSPEIMQQVMDELGAISSETVSDSVNALADLVDILLPWMQSKSNIERKTTLLVLHTVLQSYHNSLKYTYPDGKLNAGQLIGRIFCWCGDDDRELRPLVLDCILLSVDIAARHRHKLPEGTSIENIQQIKEEMIKDSSLSYETIKNLADAVVNKIPNGEIVGFAEGLIEGLLFYGDTSLVAGIGLTQHFEIRGSEISRTDVSLVESIIIQIRQIENRSCKFVAITAVVSLMKHHPEEVSEHLLSQPLPLDPGTRLCWKEIGNDEYLGNRALEILLEKLEYGNLFGEVTMHCGKNNTVSLPSLAAIIGLKYLLESLNMEQFIEKHLAEVLSVLLKYLAGWLRIEAPASLINTKYGYVPNREMQRMNPYGEVYSVITNILMIIQPNIAHNALLTEAAASFETATEENVISIVETLVKCMSYKQEDLLNMATMLGNLVSSTIAVQRAVVATFYTELIGKVDCGVIWHESMINTLYECKSDSSPLVRKHGIIGLAKITHLDQKLFDEYFDNCIDAFLDGLEETAGGEGGAEVVIESLRGISLLLLFQYKKPVNPRVLLALKPFIEKENPKMKLCAIEALGAVAINWQRSIALPTDDLIDYLLGCFPSLIIRLEDTNGMVVLATQVTLCRIMDFLRNEKLSHVIYSHLGPEAKFDFETFSKVLINCLKEEFPQRAEELRNAVVRGYSKSENDHIRATSALILGLFTSPRPEDIQRLLQLLRDTQSVVRIRASQALSFCFTS